MEAKEAETGLMEVIVESDARVEMLSIQIIPADSKVADGKNWKCISVFSTIVTCRCQSCSLFIDNSTALNGISGAY